MITILVLNNKTVDMRIELITLSGLASRTQQLENARK